MKKHIWLSKSKAEKISLSPYVDIKVNESKITLIRTDIRTMTSICCSNHEVLDQLYRMLVDGYSPNYSTPLLEDETISSWLANCIKKGLIE